MLTRINSENDETTIPIYVYTAGLRPVALPGPWAGACRHPRCLHRHARLAGLLHRQPLCRRRGQARSPLPLDNVEDELQRLSHVHLRQRAAHRGRRGVPHAAGPRGRLPPLRPGVLHGGRAHGHPCLQGGRLRQERRRGDARTPLLVCGTGRRPVVQLRPYLRYGLRVQPPFRLGPQR